MKNLFTEMGNTIKVFYDAIEGVKRKAFHNTTGLKGSELQDATSKALTQDEDVLLVFNRFKGHTFTPEQAHNYLCSTNPNKYRNTPSTSIRRAFSNLKSQGLIEKTGLLVEGNYGRLINTWRTVK